MCGIVGLLKFDQSPIKPETIQSGTDRIKNRGPDDAGIWVEPGIGLGHRRLSILDLSPSGHQPMISADGRYVIVFNGEIYNFLELRQQLDVSWKSQSDTEVVLAAYDKWGTDCLARFQGMFAFAIWDRRERVLFAARDRMGVKPFYYHSSPSCFAFASRPRALFAIHPISRDYDPQGLRLYLESGYIPAPYSAHREIHKLPPAHYLLISNNELRLERYWDFRQIATETAWERRSENSLLDELDQILRTSVRSRMISDVPLGAFLSGGIDSSLVVALMAEYSQKPVKTFTIGFDDQTHDESVHAAAVARHLKTEHHCETLKVDDLLDLLPTFREEYDEPFFDNSAFPTMAVSRLARKHVTVSLSGDGGDELFGGYGYYRLANLLSPFFKLPSPLRGGLSPLLRQLPHHRLNLLGDAIQKKDLAAGYAFARSIGKDFRGVLLPEIARDTFSLADLFSKAAQRFPPVSPAETGMRLDAAYLLPDDYLQKVDVASMAFSLESRDPLLDHTLVEWAMKLPAKWKVRGKTHKYLLRQLAYRYVPREILDRPKQGFGVPMDRWLKGPLKGWALDLLSDSRAYQDLPLSQKHALQLFEMHSSGTPNAHPLLWAVLVLLDAHSAKCS